MRMAGRDGPGRSLLVQTRGLLRRFGLKARKGLGQHFLVDGAVLGLITGAAELTPADIVVEVGPGLGVLTRELAGEAGRVVSIELDEKLAHVLKETLASCDNVTIIDGDVLRIDPVALLDEQRAHFSQAAASPSGYKVVANLPYYITAPVLRHFLEAPARPELMVVMVQKEVAEAIAAGPGKMSLMSVSVQFYGEPEVVSYVPARCFYPVPEVDSAILRIRPYLHPAVAVTDREGFFRLVRAGFSASRKQLANSLGRGLALPKAEVLALLEEAGIDPRRRAETLGLDEWARLWQVVTRAGGLAC
ncbi:MAG TPA: ribosomal RNA small subunit methyltransferase A [Dehalococcoidia bacterium]|nr:ribosomal RNA small subunit methyltransferase A [Dehalococcoidia bacterium]